jgi:hypothetical protein
MASRQKAIEIDETCSACATRTSSAAVETTNTATPRTTKLNERILMFYIKNEL